MDGITYVTPSHKPIIHEGQIAIPIIVINVGPYSIELLGWESIHPAEAEPSIRMKLLPGNMRSIAANLVRASLYPDGPALDKELPFSAVGWRIAS